MVWREGYAVGVEKMTAVEVGVEKSAVGVVEAEVGVVEAEVGVEKSAVGEVEVPPMAVGRVVAGGGVAA